MTAPRETRPVIERADRPVGQPVRQEVQVVEDDQFAQLESGVDGAADRRRQHDLGTGFAQCQHVGTVVDLAREPRVTLAVS